MDNLTELSEKEKEKIATLVREELEKIEKQKKEKQLQSARDAADAFLELFGL